MEALQEVYRYYAKVNDEARVIGYRHATTVLPVLRQQHSSSVSVPYGLPLVLDLSIIAAHFLEGLHCVCMQLSVS